MGQPLFAPTGYRLIVCYSCRIEFCITTDLFTKRYNDHRDFWCPNGHPQSYYGETDEQRRIKQLERDVAAAKSAQERAESSRKWAETRAKGANIAAGKAKAAKRRLEHRVECGVCPHCQRTFKQLAAHMKTKHGK